MKNNVVELNTWPKIVLKSLSAFNPSVSVAAEYGPIIETQFFWIYRRKNLYWVHEKETLYVRQFKNWKGAVIEVLVRFGNVKKDQK